MTQQNRQPQKTITVAGAIIVVATPFLMNFLGAWEGRAQYVVYPDRLAQGIPTVCRGLTRHVTTTPIIVGERWTPEKCLAEEERAVEKVQVQLGRCFTKPPPQMVFDMASSHSWNNGVPNTCASQAMQAWNAGDWELGCRRIALSDAGKYVWSFVRTGKVLPNGKPEMKFVQGLANRRRAEADNCLAAYT